jgi:hypothetical protein
MRSAVARLYEPLIGRDLPAVPDAIRAFREEHSSADLFSATARFAVLSFAPTQHGKQALESIVAAHDVALPGVAGDELLAECAIYASMARLPWSEPPIADPPSGVHRPISIEELRAAVRSRDRLSAERWIASHMGDTDFARKFFSAAAEDLSDFGQKLVVAVTAWRITTLMPAAPKFSVLRVAAWEWCAHFEEPRSVAPADCDPDITLKRLVDRLVTTGAPVDGFLLLSLLDAAFFTADVSGDDWILERVCGFVEEEIRQPAEAISLKPRELELPVYSLSRDYAEYLRACAIAARWKSRRPDIDWTALRVAALHNLTHGPSFEEWNFA